MPLQTKMSNKSVCVYLCWRHDVVSDVFSSNVLWFQAVICNDDFYVAIELPDTVQQHLQLCVPQECFCDDGDMRADV